MASHGNEVGSAYVSIMPETKGFNSALGKEVSKSGSLFDSLGAKATGMLGKVATAAAGVVSVAALGNFVQGAVDAYAANEQLVGGVETLYKDSSGKLMQYAQEAYLTAGMSANQYMEMATGFAGSLIQSLGGDTEKAAEYADMAMRDMSDNANKMGTDLGMIQNAYSGFAKGNFTMLDNLKLGYGGTQAEMQRLLDKANEINKEQGIITDYQIDNYADIVSAINVVQTAMDITGTTADEAAGTIEGAMSAAKGAWENWVTAIAGGTGDIDETTDALVDSVITAAENIIPRLGTVLSNLGQTLVEKLPEVATELGNGILDIFPPAISGPVREALGAAFDFLSPIAETVQTNLFPALQTLGEAFVSLGESLWPIVEALMSSVAPVVQDIIEKVVELASAIMEQAAPIFEDVAAIAEEILPHLQEIFETTMGAIQGVIDAVWPYIETIISNAMTFIGDIVNIFLALIKGDWEGVWEGIKTFIHDVWEGIKAQAQAAGDALHGVIEAALEYIKTMWSNAWERVKSLTKGAWDTVASHVSGGVDKVIGFVKDIPGKIKGYFADAGSWLINSGKAIIQGLSDGIAGAVQSAIDAVEGVLSKVREYLPFSPAHKGPFSGKGWTLYSGQSIVEGLAEGALSREGLLTSTFSGIVGNASDALMLGYTPVTAVSGSNPLVGLADEVRALHNELGDIIYTNTPLESNRSFARRVNAYA